MSWSLSVPTTKYGDFEAAVDAAVESPSPGGPEQAADVGFAKAAIKALFVSAIGAENAYVSAAASGHVCEDDAPASTYKYDSVNVSVSGQPEPRS